MAKRVAIILAAGVSSRMNTQLPKVLHEVSGRPMLAYVLDACRQVDLEKIYVVTGYGSEQIIAYFGEAEDIVWVYQDQQKGTADAVSRCRQYLSDFDGETLILCGDGPLVRLQTIETLIKKHKAGRAAVTLATAVLENPAGYGRISRDEYGNIQGIIEDGDCTEQQRAIKEVNPSYYLFDNRILFEFLAGVRPDNIKGEYYLTDVLAAIIAAGHKVVAVTAVAPEDAISINTRQQLSEVSKIMQKRIQQKLMENGVTIVDPDTTWIDARAQIGQDTVIEPFTYIHGVVTIGRGCRIGPFAYLRNNTVLDDDSILGVFTEVKNSVLGQGARVRHHSYVGDADVGCNVNIGAGAITANFDGEKVSRTQIGDNCYVGAGVVLIAPVRLKDGSHIKAGSIVCGETVDNLGQKG